MAGKVSFHFDDGHISFYRDAFPVFQAAGVVGCLALLAKPAPMTFDQALEMQAAGWEILSHTIDHSRMSEPIDEATAYREIVESKRILEEKGFRIRSFITPYSVGHSSIMPLLQEHYESAFSCYTSSLTEPIENLVIARPVNAYRLHRCGMSKKTMEELKAYVDYVAEQDVWLNFYDHDLAVNGNITAEMLAELIAYCQEKGVDIVTPSEALETERCKTKIIREGFDGERCFVHTRSAAHENKILMTSQLMQVIGSDCFECLQTNYSTDGGKTWTDFQPNLCFSPVYHEDLRTVCSDMTPLYHKKTGKFIVTGHTVDYPKDGVRPVDSLRRSRDVSYAIFDEEAGRFQEVKYVEMPGKRFSDAGSGCSQCLELDDGDLLIPFAFRDLVLGKRADDRVSVMRCSFDGETIRFKEMGRDIVVSDEVRGIGEASITHSGERYYLTIRGDTYGYVSESDDGINFTDPIKWCWEDGEIVPTYNTQSHWLTFEDKLYLVYTRRNGKNDHVPRNRAPLYCAEVNRETLTLIRESEFVVVPERGARLGNFGVCQIDGNTGLVTASEWMQPVTCVNYGSTNAVWLTEVKNI